MKFMVKFSRRGMRRPLIAETVLKTGVLISVERAHIDSMTGELLIDVPDKDAKIISSALTEAGAEVRALERSIVRDEEECVDCGACVSVCPQDVFSFDDEWRLQMEAEKCVLCGKCVIACPHNALKLRE